MADRGEGVITVANNHHSSVLGLGIGFMNYNERYYPDYNNNNNNNDNNNNDNWKGYYQPGDDNCIPTPLPTYCPPSLPLPPIHTPIRNPPHAPPSHKPSRKPSHAPAPQGGGSHPGEATPPLSNSTIVTDKVKH